MYVHIFFFISECSWLRKVKLYVYLKGRLIKIIKFEINFETIKKIKLWKYLLVLLSVLKKLFYTYSINIILIERVFLMIIFQFAYYYRYSLFDLRTDTWLNVIIEFLQSISRWGNHLLVIMFAGLSFISPSYFINTLWGTSANASLNAFWMWSGNVDSATTVPNVKTITPWGESSMNFKMSCEKFQHEMNSVMKRRIARIITTRLLQ